MAIPNQDLKTCIKCGVPQNPVEDFYQSTRRRKDGTTWPDSTCKGCVKKRSIAWTANRTPKQKAKTSATGRTYRNRLRDLVFVAYGGYVCACCGESEKKFLSLDHMNNDGAKFRKEVIGRRNGGGVHTYRWPVSHNFPLGYQVLCGNCQYGKMMNKGVCPHKVRCNDHPVTGVGSSEPKCLAPKLGEDMILSVAKVTAVKWFEYLKTKSRIQFNELNRKLC